MAADSMDLDDQPGPPSAFVAQKIMSDKTKVPEKSYGEKVAEEM